MKCINIVQKKKQFLFYFGLDARMDELTLKIKL